MYKMVFRKCLKIIVIIVSFTNLPHLYAQKSFLNDAEALSRVKKTLSHIYNYEFADAENTLKPMRVEYPEHPVLYVFDSMILYWKNFPISFNSVESEKYKKKLLAGIEKSKAWLKISKGNPEGSFYCMLLDVMLTQENFNEGHSWKAIGSMRDALPFIKDGFEMQKKFNEFYFTTGMYKYYRELFAENHSVYSAIASIFFPSGNKKYGLACLDSASTVTTWVRADATMWTCIIYLRYESNVHKSLPYAKSLVKDYPSNAYFQTIYIENLIQSGKYDEAEKALLPLVNNDNEYYKLSYAVFKGMLADHKAVPDFPEAEKWYTKAVQTASKISEVNQNYIGLAHYGLGKIYQNRKLLDQAKGHFKAANQYCNYVVIQNATKKY